MDRADPDLSKKRLDDQQLIERDRMEEIAFDVDARQPDAEVVEKRLERETARSK